MEQMTTGNCLYFLRWAGLIATAIALVILCALPADVLARGGGLRWQASHSQFGEPFFQLWTFASPWAGLSGFSIPHHNVGPPSPGAGYAPSGPLFSDGSDYPRLDRSVEFPGASSNVSSTIPSVPQRRTDRPYRTGKELDPPYFRNYDSYWHKGYWGGGQWGWANWGGIPGAGSFPRWALGPIYYASGYGDYQNPFLAEVAGRLPLFIDYAKPLDDISDDEEPPPPSTSENSLQGPPEETPEEALRYLVRSPEEKAGLTAFDAAVLAFRNKDYHGALDKTDAALEKLPHDPGLHEFRGLVLFALGEYGQAAATIYAVLAVSPGWNWATLSGLYGDQEEFTRQIRALEAYRKEHPKSAPAAFVLAWLYTTCRHTDAAAKLFQTVAETLPHDALAPPLAMLVAGAGENRPATASTSGTPVTPVSSQTIVNRQRERSPVDAAKLVGNWKASRDATTIQLELRDNGIFIWRATNKARTRQFAGHYAVGGDLLLLAAGHGTLAGTVRLREKGGFNFLAGEADALDKGLDFTGAAPR
jgi:tetratricopeptide (TPR) repeat protein